MRRSSLVYAAALAVLSVLALAAPASAAPRLLTDAEISRVLAATAATLPRPGTPAWAARTAPKAEQTFTLQAGGSKGRAAAAIVCLASSEVQRTTNPGFFLAVGEASSSCPAPVDFVYAKAELYFWVPDLNRWELASIGTPAQMRPYPTPNKVLTSVTSSNCRAAYYTVLGYHQAQLRGDTASIRTQGDIKQFTCG